MARRSGFPGPRMCDWPVKASRERGRIRSASGRQASEPSGVPLFMRRAGSSYRHVTMATEAHGITRKDYYHGNSGRLNHGETVDGGRLCTRAGPLPQEIRLEFLEAPYCVCLRGYSIAIVSTGICCNCGGVPVQPVSPTISTSGGGTKLNIFSSTAALRTRPMKVNEVIFPKLSLA